MEQEIDELRDLNAVDCDVALVLSRDDQVLLLGAVQFYPPGRDAVDATVNRCNSVGGKTRHAASRPYTWIISGLHQE